jgi:hypothetical protein
MQSTDNLLLYRICSSKKFKSGTLEEVFCVIEAKNSEEEKIHIIILLVRHALSEEIPVWRI